MNPLKVAVIGAGYMGGTHANLLARDPRVRVVAIHDAEPERASRLAQQVGARVAAGLDQAIGAADAVYVCTPNTRHTEAALAALAAGRHVFCEKPLATSLEEARAVRDAASQSQSVFQVGHNRRFAPVYVRLKEALDGRAPHAAHVKMNRGELLDPPWVGDARLTGGFLYETTLHMLDLLRYLFGEVAELTAIGSAHEYDEPDDFSMLLRFAGGVHATLGSSADAGWMFPFERVEVFCHHATLVTREMESLTASEGLTGGHATFSAHRFAKEEKWGYAQEDRAFVDAVMQGMTAGVTAEDGYRAVELVDAAYRAVRTGKRVTFDSAA